MEEVVIFGFILFSRIFNCEHLERTVDPMGSLHNNFWAIPLNIHTPPMDETF